MSEPDDQQSERSFAAPIGLDFAHPLVVALLASCALVALASRFFVSSPMWLDEALSVNISALPISRIPEALRHDGHPPLYYLLLHGWMLLFGTTDVAVRALSGVISIGTLPLAWMAGRRLGSRRTATSVALALALSPFALRFGSETRMYSMVIALVFALFILVNDTFVAAAMPQRAPRSWGRLMGIALVTAALLWTHYWSMWLLGAVGVAMVVRSVRGDRPTSIGVIGAMALGTIAFLPWLPTLLYQSAHTGTPWAKSFRPSSLIYSSLVEFAGGPYSESQLLLLGMVLLLFLGIAGRAIDNRRIEVDLAGRSDAALPLGLMVGTIAIASIAGAATGMAFAPRYASVFFPFFVLMIGLGIDRFSGGLSRNVMLVAFAALSLVGLYVAFSLHRSQSEVVASAISRTASAGLVVTCPDQLGPSVQRQLTSGDDGNNDYEVVSYPRLDDARFVDWVDYQDRNRTNDPISVANKVLERAGQRPIFVVYRDDFLTLEGQCGQLLNQLGSARPARELAAADGDVYYEPMSAKVFEPAPAK